ncbi:MAG: porin [bacterium]|nr:porin [bacterium]
MRSKLITVVTAVASTLLVAHVAAADQVQEQLMLMEQRMAEMEDRLQATSDELAAAQATVVEQQDLLIDSGLYEEEGLRSGAGGFFESVDVSGVAAASYNHRLIKAKDAFNGATPGGGGGNGSFFKNPNANTFQVDQIWITLDKAPTDESRGGFHVEFATGTSSAAQGARNGNPDVPYLYSGFVSYLAPIGNGVQVDLGKLGTVLGAEVVQTNGNYFITQGAVFSLQPVTYNGVSFSTQLTDELGFSAGVVNDVYSDTDVSADNDKAYFGQFQFAGDGFGLNVGGIIGDSDASSCGTVDARSTDCQVSVVDVVLTANPTDNLSLWVNYDWVHVSGRNTGASTSPGNVNVHGDTHGISAAGRFAITDDMGVATRVEYINAEDNVNGTADDGELLTLTGTVDKTLAEGLVGRMELRWDTILDDTGAGFTQNGNGVGTNNDQLVALWQLYYEF